MPQEPPNHKKVLKTHGQIARAIKLLAKDKGTSVNDAYNQFFRELFLNQLMGSRDGWVLKGGTNIYCRVPGARHTKDLDLYRQDDPTSSDKAAEDLATAMSGHKVGPYTFLVKYLPGNGVNGAIESERVNVEVIHGVNNRLVSFGVDVSGDLEVVGSVEHLEVKTSFVVPVDFMPQSFTVMSYPVASQIADKICAMYERHGKTPPGKASTRYHDLYDVSLLARELTPAAGALSASELQVALETQCTIRNLTLPNRMTIPDENWKIQYPLKARQFGDAKWGLDNLDEALRIAGLFIDPILSGELHSSKQTWDNNTLSWR